MPRNEREFEVPNIQVPGERRRQIIEEHRLWQRSLPRIPGQIGGTISSLVEGPPVIVTGRIEAYSDFSPVRFISVDEPFLKFLDEKGISYEKN